MAPGRGADRGLGSSPDAREAVEPRKVKDRGIPLLGSWGPAEGILDNRLLGGVSSEEQILAEREVVSEALPLRCVMPEWQGVPRQREQRQLRQRSERVRVQEVPLSDTSLA